MLYAPSLGTFNIYFLDILLGFLAAVFLTIYTKSVYVPSSFKDLYYIIHFLRISTIFFSSGYAKFNGHNSLALDIYKSTQSNTICLPVV